MGHQVRGNNAMIKRILVALSGTTYSEAVISHALELAIMHTAELVGVTDFDVQAISHVGPVPIGGGAAARDLADYRASVASERIEAEITRFENACREAEIRHSVHRERGEPFEQLTRLWRYCDLTIAGLKGLFEYEMTDRPDDILEQLIHSGVRPILATAAQQRPVRRVLIAYNGSMESAKALKRFVQMQMWPRLELHIACFELDGDSGSQLLSDAADYCRAHGFEPKVHGSRESAKRGLLPHAHEIGADLIVMGSTNRNRLLKRILGDTVLHMIRHSDIPLFLNR